MKRVLVGIAAIVVAAGCSQQKERVRTASEASAEAQRARGEATPDAGVPAAGATEAKPSTPEAGMHPADAGVTQTPRAEQHAPAQSEPVAKMAPPATGPAREAARPAAAVTQLPSGATLLTLPATAGSIVNIQLRFRTGAVDDPPGKSGLTYLTARVMTEGGTQALDAKSLLNALFPLAAELSARVDEEQTTIVARVHKDNLAKFLPIVTDVLLHPRWDPEEFKRLREAAVNDVEKRLRQGDDENLGKSALAETMYRDHPYGRIPLGHVSDLKSMSLQDLQAQAARVFTADRLTIGVSGGYPAHLGEDVAKTLAALPPKGEAIPAVPPARPHGPRFTLVEKNADSTAISMGYPWPLSHKDPDWAAMSIARSAMGEHRQMNGRLMQRLREMRGLNYGDYAYIEHFEQAGYDAVTAQTGRARHQQDFTVWLRPVRDDNRLFAVRAALYELNRSLHEEPFTPAEVEQTKGFLDGYILLMDQTDARKLGFALDDAFYGMSGFLGAWRTSLRDVTADQVNAAWRKWVDPAKLEIVMAGKDMASVRKAILSGEPTPIAYQRDATGKAPEKPAAQLATDKEMAAFPFGARGDGDVVVAPVDQLFE